MNSVRLTYINPDPPRVEAPEYPGEYYEAQVPATLDLAERARLCVNALTATTDPACDDELYWIVDLLAPESARQHFTARYATARAYGMASYSTNTHRCVNGLLLREDGFAGLRCRHSTGRVLPKQFVFAGDHLCINAACAFGHARVEVLDPHHRPYEGFSDAACDPIHGADVWHTVTWNGRADVRALWNKPNRLAITLDDASLFGFEFYAAAENAVV